MLLGISCKKDNPADKTSNLFIKALGYNGYPVAEATIVTVPNTQTVITDSYGMATIKNIPVGTYDVYAIYNNYGSGKKSVQITENSGTDVEIKIEYGNLPDFIPHIIVVEPDNPSNTFVFSSPDSVSFLLNVRNGIPGNQVVWVSDLDGEIGKSVINEDLSSSISFEGLTDGEHSFSLTTKGNENFDGNANFLVRTDGPTSVFLYPLEVESFKLKISWSYYEGNDFNRYYVMQRIEHEGGGYSESSIKTINGEWDTTTTIPIQNDYDCKYYVKVQTDNSYISSTSNMRLFEKGYLGVSFDPYCNHMVLHKYKNYVYFIYSDKVVLFDYENKEIIASRSISNIKQHYDIRYDGEQAILYLASDFRVYILDEENLNLIKTINFPNTVTSISAISNDILFTSIYQDYSNSIIYSYSLNQSKIIDSINHNESSRLFLNRVPENNKIIVYFSNYQYELKYLNYNTNGEINGFDNTSALGNSNYDDYPFSFSPNSEYFIPSRYNSKVLKTNDDISTVGGLSNIYDFKDFTYSPNSDTIFGLTSNKFITFTYPGLEIIDEFETEHYYKHVQRKGDDFYCLINISDSYYNSYYFMKQKPL